MDVNTGAISNVMGGSCLDGAGQNGRFQITADPARTLSVTLREFDSSQFTYAPTGELNNGVTTVPINSGLPSFINTNLGTVDLEVGGRLTIKQSLLPNTTYSLDYDVVFELTF